MGHEDRIPTVPPPPGEDDAYSAETKVGPASAEEWVALIRQANEEGRRGVHSATPDRPKPDAAMPAVPLNPGTNLPQLNADDGVEESASARIPIHEAPASMPPTSGVVPTTNAHWASPPATPASPTPTPDAQTSRWSALRTGIVAFLLVTVSVGLAALVWHFVRR